MKLSLNDFLLGEINLIDRIIEATLNASDLDERQIVCLAAQALSNARVLVRLIRYAELSEGIASSTIERLKQREKFLASSIEDYTIKVNETEVSGPVQ